MNLQEYVRRNLQISDRKNKKYAIVYNGKTIHFGDNRYPHYSNEKIPRGLDIYPVHNDPVRRLNYLKRATKITDGKNNLTYTDPSSPNFWSVNILW